MNLEKKMQKHTRKFEIDGVVVTTTTSKIIYGDEENQTFYDEHYFRKQELRELKLLQKQEQKQFQVCNYLLLLFIRLLLESTLVALVANVIAKHFQKNVSTLVINCS